MEEDKEEIYIKLFYPLSNLQKKEIWKIWENSIYEDLYIRKKEIEKYCIDNDCDFLAAICSIYQKFCYLVIISFFNEKGKMEKKYFSDGLPGFVTLEEFFEKRIVEYLNSGEAITKKQEKTIQNLIFLIYNGDDDELLNIPIKTFAFLESIDVWKINERIEEKNDLTKHIYLLGLQRQKNPERFINDISNIPIAEFDFDKQISIFAHTKEMYYPISKIKKDNNSEIDKYSNQEKTTKESRETLNTDFSETELIVIFNELVKQEYISCDLDLFLSCFGFKENKEDRIVWMKTKTEFEIFITEIVEKEENPVNKAMCFPRKKINYWFMDQNSNSIEAVKNINCDEKSYQIYKIIHP